MKSTALVMRRLAILGIVGSAFLAGCGSGGGRTDGHGLITGVTVSPSSATVQAGGVAQFTAIVTPSGTSQAVTWSVSGMGCTGASCGTIDASGKYTAPATVPNPATVTITARSVVDATNAGTAAVTINTGPGDTASGLSVAVAPDLSGKFGKFAYVANYRSNKVSMYTINAATGALTSIGTIDAGLSPSSIAIDPSGRFAYVANFGKIPQPSDVSMYTINAATGTLVSIGTVGAGPQTTSVAVDPSGKFAYVGSQGGFVYEGCGLYMYTINATSGILTPTGTIDSCFPAAVAVHPSGKFAYAAARGDSYGPDCCGAVFMHTIDAATGALTSIGTIAAESIPSSIAIDPSGKFAYMTIAGHISMYSIDASTGVLTPLVPGTIAAGLSPTSIAIDPSGKFTYVANSGSNDISMYSIEPDTGALTLIGTIGM